MGGSSPSAMFQSVPAWLIRLERPSWSAPAVSAPGHFFQIWPNLDSSSKIRALPPMADDEEVLEELEEPPVALEEVLFFFFFLL